MAIDPDVQTLLDALEARIVVLEAKPVFDPSTMTITVSNVTLQVNDVPVPVVLAHV